MSYFLPNEDDEQAREEEAAIKPLTRDEVANLAQKANYVAPPDPMQIVYWQVIFVVALLIIAYVWKGQLAAISAFLGGAAYTLPSLVFAIRLKTRGYAMSQLLISEFIKVVLTILLLVIIVKNVTPLDWMFFLGALILTVQAYFFVGLRTFKALGQNRVKFK